MRRLALNGTFKYGSLYIGPSKRLDRAMGVGTKIIRSQRPVTAEDHKEALRAQTTQKRTKKTVSYNEDSSEDDDEDSKKEELNEEEEVYIPQPSSSSLVSNDELTGSDVYKFKTNTKSNQMALKVAITLSEQRAAQEKSPDANNENIATPKSKRRASENAHTPVGRRSQQAKLQKAAASTPYRLRERNEVDCDVSASSSDESVPSSDDGSDSGAETPMKRTPNKTPQRGAKTPVRTSKSAKCTPVKTPGRTPRRRKMRDEEEDDTVKAESVQAYFSQDIGGPILTSDRTLARLEMPQLDSATVDNVLTDYPAAHSQQRHLLVESHKADFNKWMYQLCNGYNLLFYGLGSKRALLEQFRVEMLAEFTHVVVNGYFPSITIKSVLNSITEDILEHLGSFRSPVEQCDFIRRCYECGDYSDLYIMVHNIDGAMLRARKLQDTLSLLAQVRGVHFIASIDHINAPLIWDSCHTARYNWLWHDVTTFAPYTCETSYENSLLVDRQGAPLALSALTHVLRSLTANARGIFLLLAQHQLAADSATYQGLPHPELYKKCREAFLVNSDLTLNTQLTEFRDHKLIKSKKGLDGVEYLTIPLDESTLKEFLEQQDDWNS